MDPVNQFLLAGVTDCPVWQRLSRLGRLVVLLWVTDCPHRPLACSNHDTLISHVIAKVYMLTAGWYIYAPVLQVYMPHIPLPAPLKIHVSMIYMLN